jgi:putative inorganic carbon (hco3(-)) transporter
MVLATVLLYVACLYIRPGEIVPGWENAHIVQIVSAVATIAALGSCIVRPRKFWDHPLDKTVIGFFLIAVVSNIAWGWAGGAIMAATKLAPAIFGYFLVRCGVRTPTHFRVLVAVVVALTVFQAVNGIVQYQTGRGLGNVTAIQDPASDKADETPTADDDDSDEAGVMRIRGTGVFNDPNDLAMVLIVAVPFLVFGSLQSPRWVYRAASLVALAAVVAAICFTYSRGGFLALCAMTVTAVRRRFGARATAAVAVLGVIALLAAAPSRMAAVDPGEESAQGRVDAWSEGFTMLKMDPALGVGFGQFTDYNELVAHNSFVHTLGELGLCGGFFFTGMFYWFFKATGHHRLAAADAADRSWRVDAWGQALATSGIGFLVCACFLSRQYSEVMFLMVALGASFGVVARTVDPAVDTLRAHLRPMTTLLCASVGVMYIATRVLLVVGQG